MAVIEIQSGDCSQGLFRQVRGIASPKDDEKPFHFRIDTAARANVIEHAGEQGIFDAGECIRRRSGVRIKIVPVRAPGKGGAISSQLTRALIN